VTGEAVTPVVGAWVVDGCVELDCVELEPHAPTDATTSAAAVINRMDINVCVVVLKIALPRPGWHLGADGADVGGADGMRLPHSGRRSASCGTSRVKQYQLRIVDPAFSYTTVQPDRPGSWHENGDEPTN
jgi:hypothetical protein